MPWNKGQKITTQTAEKEKSWVCINIVAAFVYIAKKIMASL